MSGYAAVLIAICAFCGGIIFMCSLVRRWLK